MPEALTETSDATLIEGRVSSIQVVNNGAVIATGVYNDANEAFWYTSTSTTSTATNAVIHGNLIVNGTLLATSSTSNTIWPGTTGFITSTTGSTFTVSGGVWTTATADWGEVRKLATPRVKKSTKNAIKRALKLMMGMGFEEDVRVFLNGDSIEISHPDSLFKFVITKYSRSLINRTEYPGYSTPYKLELYTKSNVHVADLCVYMEQTPVLDQVLGVAMFIKSGSEEMILKQANWSRLNSDMEMREILALEYPYLEKKLRLSERRVEANCNYVAGDLTGFITQSNLLEMRA